MILNSCEKIEPLTIPQMEYYGNELNINGFYRYKVDDENYYEIIVFYRNGICFVPSSISENGNLEDYSTYQLERKSNWGTYYIKDSTIKISSYIPTMYSGLISVISEGLILNDSTFILNAGYRNNQKKSFFNAINITFNIQKSNEKPDSTYCFFNYKNE